MSALIPPAVNAPHKNMLRLPPILLALSIIAALFCTQSVYAHAMVAQHGTLNFVDKHVFLLLSLPVSAFANCDDNNDGEVSMLEFNLHRKDISEEVNKGIYLGEKQEKYGLEGLLLSPSVAHTAQNKSIEQVTIMGRYTLPAANTKVHFTIGVFSAVKALQRYSISASYKQQNLKHQFELTLTSPSQQVFN